MSDYTLDTGEVVPSTSSRIVWQHITPGSYRSIRAKHGPFDLDAAADPRNHVTPRWLGPGGVLTDALGIDPWPPFRRAWCNPPHGMEAIFR